MRRRRGVALLFSGPAAVATAISESLGAVSSGSCETEVLGGIPLHRDSVLSEEERESNETMMICVSRSLTPVLELDL